MGKIIVYENVTLDGVVEAPEMCQFRYLSDDVAELIKAQILDTDAILLGVRIGFAGAQAPGLEISRSDKRLIVIMVMLSGI